MEGNTNQHVGIDGDGAARFEVFPRGADDGRVEVVLSVEHGHEEMEEVEKSVVDEGAIAQNGAVIGVLCVMEGRHTHVGVVAFDGDVNVELRVCLVVASGDYSRHIHHHRQHHASNHHTHLTPSLRVHDVRF